MQQELDWGGDFVSDGGGETQPDSPPLPGEVIFSSAEEQAQRSAELLGAGALLVTLPPPIKDARGRLGELLEELVERELARQGAPSPYLAAWSAMPEDAQATLADQLFRARSVGATGLAIAMGSLRAIANPTLCPDDSATLRWLANTTRESPLVLLVDDGDVTLLAYPSPVPLTKLLATSPVTTHHHRDPRDESPAPSMTVTASLSSSPSSEMLAEVVVMQSPFVGNDIDVNVDVALTTPLPIDQDEDSGPVILSGDDVTTNDTKVAAVAPPVPSIDAGEAILQAAVSEPCPAPATATTPEDERTTLPDVRENEPVIEAAPAPEEPAAPAPAAEVEVEAPPAPEVLAPSPAIAALAPLMGASSPSPSSSSSSSSSQNRRTRRTVTAGIPVSGPNDAWRTWAIALSAAKGAQPLAVFERLFAESYVPLSNAIAAGLDDPRAIRAYDEFRRSFERSYTDGFATFGATNRRPRLVMDAYDVASKQARLHNARSAHILVVDSMRFDVGCMVRDALSREAVGFASLTSENILWSALPTTTIRQLETFARGIDALRAPAREEPSESLRGRAAEVVRRLRVGSRELYKLDLIPAMLETRISDVVGALPEIAEATAEAIARHVSTLPPRTLLFVLGDHGFSIDRRGEVKTGGASPEEVLVPAFAWLVGELH